MGNRIITPTLATGALPGITRSLVIEWCGVEEMDLPWESLSDADALMLTSSTRDVQPVHRIDERDLSPLPQIARDCVTEFRRRATLDIDP
jgi:branched-chain amino acid aminotransferase